MNKLRIAMIVGVVAVPLSLVLYDGVRTLRVLTVIERERDRWQRPEEVLRTLALDKGGVVVDLGSGAGYFALKLSPIVGTAGAVLAEDIRGESLAFLWIRTFLRNARNVHVILGEPDNPHLPNGTADAVLIANAYHELAPAKPILAAVFAAMKPGARLVIVDRGPRNTSAVSRTTEAERHELSLEIVEREIREGGFETICRRERFIDRPDDDDLWWLLAARKPMR